MQYVLVSSCLLGNPVRYDGRGVPVDHPCWRAGAPRAASCPSVRGRRRHAHSRPPAEIEPGADAAAVLAGRARVVAVNGEDVTAPFVQGAGMALDAARRQGIRIAVLKQGSPSCGSAYVYDGRFQGQRQPGQGVTATLLRDAGLQVFSEQQWDEAQACLLALEDAGDP